MAASSSVPRVSASGAATGKCDELRSLIRVAAQQDSSISSGSALLANLFLGSSGDVAGSDGGRSANSTASSGAELSREKFCSLIQQVRGVRARFTPNDMIDIYNEAAAEISGGGLIVKVTTVAIVDYFSSAISKTRSWSIKLRSAIMQDFDGSVEGYKRAFTNMSPGSGNVVDINSFTDFAEDMLDLDERSITEAEAKALYAIFDVNNDGQLTLDDFLSFMLGQTAEAISQLNSGNGEVIVDVKVSTTPVQEAALRGQGYTQLLPDAAASTGAVIGPDHGSFGKGYSLWIWRRKQGTCSGRLKPIVDIQLESAAPASNSVLVGYQSIPIPLGSSCVWIKRAVSEDEEKDAIVDIKVTIGKSKNSGDRIWTSPGVGWVLVGRGGTGANFGPKGLFSSLDAFVWFRPARARTTESAMVTVLNAVAAMTEETRQAKLLSAVRSAIRSYVPLVETRRLANLQMESSDAANTAQMRSERMYDYSALFHEYSDTSGGFMSKSGSMSKRNFQRMLLDVGMNMDSADMTRCYNYFDKDLDGNLSRVEFAFEVAHTGYELDAIVDRIRNKLLASRAGYKTGGAAVSRGPFEDPTVKNPLRESRILSHIFRHVNVNRDSILSLDEILDLAARLEIFLTEDEARRIAQDMDINGDDRVEEDDFISFMKRGSEAVVKKAHRLHSAAAKLRRWLIAGTNTSSSALVTISAEQWNDFMIKHDKSTLRKFPGYLCSEDISRTLASLGYMLSSAESREMLIIVAPDANGQIRQADLNAFMNRSSRSLGELVALLERDIMKDVVDQYRSSCVVLRNDGVPDSLLVDKFATTVKDQIKRIQTSQANSAVTRTGLPQASNLKATHDVVSVAQLKAGIEASMGRVPSQGAGMMPNLEEYVSLAALVGALVADEETLGINAKKFVEGVCMYVVKVQDGKTKSGGEALTLDGLCRDLRRMIREEAKAAGGGRSFDFVTAFSVFDEDGGGSISLNEFKGMLKRLQLIDKLPEKQVPALLECFDRNKKGHVTFEDFLAFVETNRDEDDDDYALDDDDQADEIGLSSNTPPASITRNADCDWLLWFLWRQACRVSSRDPENVIAEMEASCVAADKRANAGTSTGEVSVKTFWGILGDKKLHGAMTRGQFDRGVKFVVHDGTGKDDDPMEYESVARYTVRMGRTFNGMLQQRRVVDEKKFSHLRSSLIKDLLDIDSSSVSSESKSAVVDDDAGAFAAPGQIMGSRFERVLRRLDTNGDGMLTVPEFKMALKRLKVRDEKQWTAAMVRRLFDERASHGNDGKLSISEFGKMVRGDLDVGGLSASRQAGPSGDLSDDEDDDVFTTAKVATSDSALYRKASDILLELVPLNSSSYSPGAVTAHCEAVRAAVRHFFIKADPQGRGLVSEDQFRIFARKSGLQTRLRVAELRRLISKLRRRAGDEVGADSGGDDGEGRLYSGRGNSSSSSNDAQVDYEKLCKLIGPTTDSQPRSRIDALMLRVQDAADVSTAQGRSFLALCTLTDPMLAGHITETELGIVMKMMGCPLTGPEVEIIRDQISDIEVENLHNSTLHNSGKREGSPDGRSKASRVPKGSIDYRQVNVLIQTYQCARLPASSYEGLTTNELRQSTRSLSGALPAYATLGVTRMPSSTIRGVPPLDIARAVPTPGGMFLSTPLPPSAAGLGMGMGMGMDVSRMRASGGLSGNAYDRSIVGLAERIKNYARRAQSSQQPHVMLRRRLENADRSLTGVVAEESLQIIFEDMGVSLSPADLYALRSRYGNLQGGVDYESLCVALGEVLEGGMGGTGVVTGSYGHWEATPGVVRRARELVADGVVIRQAFADFDYDDCGVVEVRRFVEVIKRLSLLQTERQLNAAVECFASHADKALVNYVDFCQAVVRAETFGRTVDHEGSYGYGGSRDRSSELRSSFVFGSGYDGVASRSRDWGSSGGTDLDDQGDGYRGRGLSASGRPPLSRAGLSSSSSSSLRMVGRGSSSGLSASQVGSRQWGSDTPLELKGRPLDVGRDSWACSVCLYAENPVNVARCIVCDTTKKARPGGAGCVNCRFVNEPGDRECAMCGLSV